LLVEFPQIRSAQGTSQLLLDPPLHAASVENMGFSALQLDNGLSPLELLEADGAGGHILLNLYEFEFLVPGGEVVEEEFLWVSSDSGIRLGSTLILNLAVTHLPIENGFD